ncbi:MAG: FecR domain-containing protein [Bdellovibrionaceae bacterium]|nr:FecR domain-containing protein [Pseudobdellovibrionaceae bacterium]
MNPALKIIAISSLFFLHFAKAYHGKAMIVRGQAERISTQEPSEKKETIKVGTRIFQGDSIETAAGGFVKIVMTDRNIINISENSKVIIKKYENDHKNLIKNVELSLESGKVRTDVKEKYDGEKNKFIIKTPVIIAGVRGTDFIVKHDRANFISEVLVVHGNVDVETLKDSNPSGLVQAVKAGQIYKVKPSSIQEKPTNIPEELLKSEVDKDIDNVVKDKEKKNTDSKPLNTKQTE